MRRRAARARGAPSFRQSPRDLAARSRERPSSDMAGPFHRAHRDRRRSRADRSRLGAACSADPRGPEAIPACSYAARNAARGRRSSRTTTTITSTTRRSVRSRRATPFVTSLGVGAHLEAWACSRSASPSSTGGVARASARRRHDHRRAVPALLGPHARDRQCLALVVFVVRSGITASFQRRYRAH